MPRIALEVLFTLIFLYIKFKMYYFIRIFANAHNLNCIYMLYNIAIIFDSQQFYVIVPSLYLVRCGQKEEL